MRVKIDRMLKMCAIIAVAIMLGSCTQKSAKMTAANPKNITVPLRVMTFNIRFEDTGTGKNSWQNRKSLVAGTMRFHDLDVIGLQEALRSQIDTLQQRLPEFNWIGVGRDDGADGGEFSPVFYRRNRLKLLRQSTFWLSETPEIAGKMGWDAACNRVVTWGFFEDIVTGKQFYFFNTHFDHKGETARRESAKLVRRKIAEIAGDYPAILVGDFNATEDTEVYQTITQNENATGKPLLDAFYTTKQAHHGPLASYNGFKPKDDGRRIDYIFVHPEWTIRKHAILAERFGDQWASDHFAVIAEMELR